MTSIWPISSMSSSDSEDDIEYEPSQDGDFSESSYEDHEGMCDDDNLKSKDCGIDSKIEESKAKPETSKVSVTCDEKKRTEDIWKSFLSDVSQTETYKKTSDTTIVNTEKTKIISRETKEPNSEKTSKSKIFEFAGETSVKKDNVCDCITKQENISNKVTVSESTSNPLKKRSCLDSVLRTIYNKKQKPTILVESVRDWDFFKRNEGIEEELEKFNKGKQGFIERQRFLQRADLRSFDIEKDMRQSLRKKLI